jgi:hypothetical protein
MPNATWPSTLPGPIVDSIDYKPWKNVINTPMDVGNKSRRRFTAVGQDVTMQVPLLLTQVQTLDDFVALTLKDVLPFDWVDFRKPLGTTATYKFKSRPQYKMWGDDYVLASLDLQMLP